MGIGHLKALRRTTDDGVFPLTWMAACSQQADFRVSSTNTGSRPVSDFHERRLCGRLAEQVDARHAWAKGGRGPYERSIWRFGELVNDEQLTRLASEVASAAIAMVPDGRPTERASQHSKAEMPACADPWMLAVSRWAALSLLVFGLVATQRPYGRIHFNGFALAIFDLDHRMTGTLSPAFTTCFRSSNVTWWPRA